MTANPINEFRALFTSQIRQVGAEPDLPLAALYLAGEDCPDLDVNLYLRQIGDMAEEVRSMVGGTAEGEAVARALNHYLFDVKRFSGNDGDYYNPDNSFLNRVMDTGIGIPITLSVLYLGVAARLGLNCHGVGMPGHFLVKLEEIDLYMDPFHGGQLLSAGDCRRLAEQLFGPGFNWDERYLSPTPAISVLARMLNNLRVIYAHRRDLVRLTGVLERMLLIDPTNLALCQELAICHVEQGNISAAVRSLEELISISTIEEDLQTAQDFIRKILGEE
jgi:regulator of sirC expression with transglutaminase-like and TPR domain